MADIKKKKILQMAEDLTKNPTNREEYEAYNENLAK